MKLKHLLLAVIALCATTVAIAQSPFDGTWNLNTSKSQLAGDTMTFQDAGNGSLKFANSEQSYTFKTDGSSVTTPMGAERTFKKTGDNSYEATSKRNGTLISTSTWKISDDGKSLALDAKGTKPNGDAFENSLTYVKTSPGKGLVGSWRSKDVKLSSPSSLTIQTEGKDDVTLTISAEKASCKAKWDGKPYPVTGPTVPDGITLTLTKTGPKSFKSVQKVKDKALDVAHYTLSADGKTLTNKGTDGEGKEAYTEVWEKQS